MDLTMVIGAVLVMTLLDGTSTDKWDMNPILDYEAFASGTAEAASKSLPFIFGYAIKGINGIINYAMTIGVILSVIVGINATKIITEKRLEFFREAASGISVGAFYAAANITNTFEQGLSVIIAAAIAFWLRNPATEAGIFYLHFFMLSWLCVSWALLLPFIVPQKNVSTVTAFFMAFFGLLFCGRVAPGTFKNLYDEENTFLALFAGFVSPSRYFVEGVAVTEARCLPEQSGFTVDTDDAWNYHKYTESYSFSQELTFMAQNDIESAISRSCSGWYWGLLPSLMVGITVRIAGALAIHLSGRSQQAKNSFKKELIDAFNKRNHGGGNFIFIGLGALILLLLFFGLSCWLILRT